MDGRRLVVSVSAMKNATPNARLDLDAIAFRLRVVREAFGMNSGDFAQSIGVDASSYSKIEAGKKPLKMEMGYSVAEAYGVSMDYLYRGRLTDLPERIAAQHRQSLKNQDL